MGKGCRDICLRHKTTEKFERGFRYSDSTCWCKACNVWLDRETGIVNFRCICCHGKVRIMARAHWRNRK